jgi:hypothetical protein
MRAHRHVVIKNLISEKKSAVQSGSTLPRLVWKGRAKFNEPLADGLERLISTGEWFVA